jgi:hypothetical protein
MKLEMDDWTSKVLKNFATINEQVLFRPGNKVITVSRSRKIMARATINPNLDRTFGIDNLASLINSIELFNEPTITLKENFLTIQENQKKLTYTYTDPASVQTVSQSDESKLESLKYHYEFELKMDVLKDIQKAAGVLKAEDIVFLGDGGTVFINTLNSEVSNTNSYSIPVGETDTEFRLIMKRDHLNKLSVMDYTVRLIFDKKWANFSSSDLDYWIAMEA